MGKHDEAHRGGRDGEGGEDGISYRNTGRAAVRIESVHGVCVCCTAAYATKKKLAPGESGAVVVRVDFEKKPLPLVKVVTVKTDDGETVALIVEVHPKP